MDIRVGKKMMFQKWPGRLQARMRRDGQDHSVVVAVFDGNRFEFVEISLSGRTPDGMTLRRNWDGRVHRIVRPKEAHR